MSIDFVTKVNGNCLKYSHEHRRASADEIVKYKLPDKKKGCCLCSKEKNRFIQTQQWVCPNFSMIISVSLPLDNRIILFSILSNRFNQRNNEFQFYLPNELIMHIFSFCSYKKRSHLIDRVTCSLIDHTHKCRPCAKRFIDILTTKTCPNHMITRHSLERRRQIEYFADYHM